MIGRIGGYYSYNIGSGASMWHIIVLNSECQPGQTGLWLANGCIEGSAQDVWLENDLDTAPTNNILAIFHKPRFSSSGSFSHLQNLWQDLYDGGADIVLGGHWHNYERLGPTDASGNADPDLRDPPVPGRNRRRGPFRLRDDSSDERGA